MLQVVKFPKREEWDSLLKRPALSYDALTSVVEQVMDEVRAGGDEALRAFTKRFDRAELGLIGVTPGEFEEAKRLCDPSLMEAIETAAANIRLFHSQQIRSEAMVETMPGVRCWREVRAIEKVGLYVPGGSAPLFSTVLMLGIPAVIAGCSRIVLCTPPDPQGKVHPAILASAHLIGISEVYKVGGIQAIAALTYGTESIPAVDKIFGPGNQYVTAAKQRASLQGVAIDMPAGPSEVLVMADATSNPAFVASDLLSQAEHGPDSQVILLTCNPDVVKPIEAELYRQLDLLPRKELAVKSLENSKIILLNSMEEMMEMSNAYAPEHLIISTDGAEQWVPFVRNAGSVFLGHYAPESAGDYASGTNHALPTSGYARAYSGVSTDSFIKKITFQNITSEGFAQLGPVVEKMAAAERLEAHRRAATVRLKASGNS